MNELFCCKAAEGLKARFDTTHQNFEVFRRGSPLPDGLPNLNGGMPPQPMAQPWQPIPKAAILQLRLLRSLPSESAHPVTASQNLQFLIASTGQICYHESTNSSQNLNFTEIFRSTSFIRLDYDLGEGKTGYDVLAYMKENDVEVKHINIHSDHSVGVPKMREYVWKNFPNVSVTFNPLQFK